MKVALTLLAAVLLAPACGRDPVAGPGGILVRVSNVSAVDLSNVTLHLGGEVVEYGDVPVGRTIGYRPVSGGFSLVQVTVRVSGREHEQGYQYDFIGEALPFQSGSYTAEVSFDAGATRVSMQLAED